MKKNQIMLLLGICLLVMTTACSKYGYEIPDGYPDDSGNIKDAEIDTNLRDIDKSMYAKARVFPGLVDQAEPRVEDVKFTLDMNFTDQTAQNLRISVAPDPQYSTGYYAAPGELIKIVVPSGIEGLTVQIGGHTDNLSGKYPLLRDPVIYMRQRLYAGDNYVRNLYGGTIYIRANRAYETPVEFSISNACVSPDFVLGEISDAEWVAKVKASQVPWLEMRAERVVFLIPRDRVIQSFSSSSSEPITNPTAVMTRWNDVFEQDYNGWMGLSDDAEDIKDLSPQGPWRGILDIQLSAGYGHSGFPFVGLNDGSWFRGMTSLSAISMNEGMWGMYHEFGHNCQQNSMWSWSTLGETTNNLFNFKVAHRLGADYTKMHRAINSGFPLAIAWAGAAGTKNFDGTDAAINDPFRRMTPFIQIFEKYGYEAMTHLYKEARHAERTNPSDITKHNWVFEKLSDYTKTNLAPFFDAWGINYSPAVADRVAAKHPRLKKQIWKYNPLTRTGGDELIVLEHDKAGWIATATNAQNAYPASNLIDGGIASIWLACHNNCSSPGNGTPLPAPKYPTPENPLYLTINTNSTIEAGGFYLVQRQTNAYGMANHVKEIGIEIYNNGVWEDLGRFPLEVTYAKQYITLPAEKTFSQFRIKIDTRPNGATENNAAMAEVGTWD